jgi:hyperosmotically inducible periplasmic protein
MKNKPHTSILNTTALTLSFALCAYSASGIAANADRPLVQPVASAFSKLDTNQDHRLNHDEAVQDQDLAQHFENADIDRNGSLSKQEFEQFKQAAQQSRMEAFLDDTEVTEKIRDELVHDNHTRSLNISVETYKGEVILSGFVDTDQQAHRAVEIASSVQGVQTVKNSLVVKG